MRRDTLIALSLIPLSASFLVIPPHVFDGIPASYKSIAESYFNNPYNPSERSRHPLRDQQAMNPGPAIPEDRGKNAPSDKGDSDGSLTISDVLPKTRSINVFAGLCRDVSSVAGRLESMSASSNTTLLAPLNSVMQNLPRKPWEDPPDSTDTVDAAYNEDKAASNIERFVKMHVVQDSPWKEGEKVETLGGKKVWWERKDGKRVVMPDDIEVDGVVGRVGNGEVWAVKGVVNYQ